MAAMTSSNQDIENLRKRTLAYVLETIWVKHNQIWLSRLGCRAETDTQTDTDTETQTDTLGPS